jgi:uncharacterized glyoxalase superfamily protein PhnB
MSEKQNQPEFWSNNSSNRSMPPAVVIPELVYPDVVEAVAWLVRAFGFTERLRIGTHRVQLLLGEGSIIVTAQQKPGGASLEPQAIERSHSLLVRVSDADAHYEQAEQNGARIIRAPENYPYGERQYTAEDPAGHRWTFSQTIADVDPETWGGKLLG